MPGPAMGPGPSLGPEGAANIGTPMMPDNGAVVMYYKFNFVSSSSWHILCCKDNFTLKVVLAIGSLEMGGGDFFCSLENNLEKHYCNGCYSFVDITTEVIFKIV